MDNLRGPSFALRFAFAAIAAALALWPCRAAAQTQGAAVAAPAPASAPVAAPALAPGSESLAAARKDLISVPPAELAARLAALAAALPPADAVDLIGEQVDKVPVPAARAKLCETAAGLYLLLGDFTGAAAFYRRSSAQSPTGDPAALLRAARCEIAAGENDRARELAASVLRSLSGAAGAAPAAGATEAQAHLVDAWALFFAGRTEAARSAALAVKAAPSSPGRKEADFLAWVSSTPAAKAAAAARLAKEFPDSPEALMAAGSLPLAPLPHWYLGRNAPEGPAGAAGAPASVGAAGAPASVGAVPVSATQEAAEAASAASPSPVAGSHEDSRLQVGYFSVESNARNFAAELSAKGFRAAIDVRKPAPGSVEGTRWIVYVEGGADPDALRLRLKDAGYESYPMD